MEDSDDGKDGAPVDLDSMVRSYEQAALFCETDEVGDPLAQSCSGFDGPGMELARRECAAFLHLAGRDARALDAESLGVDFWLTRNGHGSGFWDRGLGDLGDRLSEVCSRFGPCYAETADRDRGIWLSSSAREPMVSAILAEAEAERLLLASLPGRTKLCKGP